MNQSFLMDTIHVSRAYENIIIQSGYLLQTSNYLVGQTLGTI